MAVKQVRQRNVAEKGKENFEIYKVLKLVFLIPHFRCCSLGYQVSISCTGYLKIMGSVGTGAA